jgi:two-component system, OmpR family, response regulator
MGNVIGEKTRSILVVDDDTAVAEFLRLALEQQGYQPTVKLDPQLAIDWVARAPTPPAVALVDFLMPRMTGIELAERLRGLIPGLPLILLTGSIMVPDLVRLQALQPCRIMQKPFRLPELRNTIESFFPPDNPARLAETG